jgi:outer membrane protein
VSIKPLLHTLLFLSLTSRVEAVDLMEVYHQALENDTQFKMAYSTFMSNTEALPQARAALLPQLTAKAQGSANQQNVTAGVFGIKDAYRSRQWQLQATQAIFNYQAWSKLLQAKASVKAAHATFNDAAQNLILRTCTAYLNILYAQDSLTFAEAKKRANKRQLDQAKQRYDVGLEPITSVYNAQSAYDQSTADVIQAQNDVVTQNEELRKLTNHVYNRLAPLRNQHVPLITPEPNDIEEWVATSLKQNYKLLASRFSLQAARENIKAMSAGNYPVFSLQGGTIQTHNNAAGGNITTSPAADRGIISNSVNSFFVPAGQQLSNVAITVNLPIFQGGLVQSQTRQAQYEFQTSSDQMENIHRSVMVYTRVTYNSILSEISKIKADRQTLMSQENTVQSTETQFLVGTRTMVDVVNAQQHLFEAQLQLSRDQYNYMNSILQIKYLAGTLNVDDLAELNAWLSTTQLNEVKSHS